MEKLDEKIPGTSGVIESYEVRESPDAPQSVGGDSHSITGGVESTDVRLAQLSEKINALDEKVKSLAETRKWSLVMFISIAGTILTAIGLLIGATTIVYNFLKDNQDNYRNLQNTYYEKLIDVQKTINSNQITQLPSTSSNETTK